MNYRKLLWVVCLMCCLSAQASDDTVTLNLVNAEVSAVLKLASELTGKLFVLDPKVKANVNVVSAAPMPRSLIYPTLVAALRLQGIAAVEDGKVVRILPEADARNQSVSVGGSPLPGDAITTRMFTLKYEAAQTVAAAIKPLLHNAATIVTYASNNTLVVTDYSQNLKRLEVVLAAIDVPGVVLPLMVPLSYVTATELAPLIQNLMTDGPVPGPGVPNNSNAASGGSSAANAVAMVGDSFAVYAEPHSNSLLVRSSSPGKLLRAQQLIKQLDRPEAGSNIEVIYLKNAVASEVAQMLRAILSADPSTAKAAGSSSGESNNTSSLNPGRQSNLTQGGSIGGGNAAGFGQSGSNAGNGGWQTTGGLAQGSYVQADVANNAILISAPNVVIERLRKVITQMDLRRAQIYVEALIAEVSSDTAAQFGIQWQALSGLDKGVSGSRVVGGTNFPNATTSILNWAQNPVGTGSGLNLGISNGTITLPNGNIINNLMALASFLETTNNGNILSTPNLMTLDNQEAQIMIGQDVPIVTGSYSSTSSSATVTPFQTFERRKVGLSLRILPQVSEGGMVRMKIIQEASSVVPSSVNASSGPTINTRTIETAVQVQDGGLIVLGGLLQDSLSDTENKVPVLGDVPVVGGLFRHTGKTRTKTNLLVFIRPKTLRTAQEDAALSTDRYNYIQGLQKTTNEKSKQDAGPLLAPLDLKVSTRLSLVPSASNQSFSASATAETDDGVVTNDAAR